MDKRQKRGDRVSKELVGVQYVKQMEKGASKFIPGISLNLGKVVLDIVHRGNEALVYAVHDEIVIEERLP